MKSLSKYEKELIFDYCFGLTTDEEAGHAEELISSRTGAAELHARLKRTLKPLEQWKVGNCPDELAEGTVFRLTNCARSSQVHLEQLLQKESGKAVASKVGFWRHFGELAAIAAMILIFAGVFPALRSARQKSWQSRCQANLLQIARGIDQYTLDNNGNPPAVAIKEGYPWWKIGSRSKENCSNTRSLWLLVKQGYVEPEHFVCPGRSQGRAISLSGRKVEQMLDFPSRRYVTYSFRLIPGRDIKSVVGGKQVLMADLNPVFETIFERLSKKDCNEFSLDLRKEKRLLIMNSSNHNRRGQNVLFSNGSIIFNKRRTIGRDDIFTIKNKEHYRGSEVPYSHDDTFLAP